MNVLTHNKKMLFKYQEYAPGFSHKCTLKNHMQNHTWDKPISVNNAERGVSVYVRLNKHI